MSDQYDRLTAWAKSDGSDQKRDPNLLSAEDVNLQRFREAIKHDVLPPPIETEAEGGILRIRIKERFVIEVLK